MSAGGAFGGARGYQPRPPEKGVFPLDHFGECTTAKEDYLRCLKEHGNEAELCRDVAKKYLECRMNKQLMAPQELKELGFDDAAEAQRRRQGGVQGERQRERSGFVAGLRKFEGADK